MLWGLDNTGQTGGTADADIDAPEAWDITTGSSSVVVAVIDEGVDYNHEDLAANMWINPGEVLDGNDTDGNGYIDDIYGWDFYNDDNTVFDPADGDDHGTHVSGTIGAEGDNGVGVVGVNWQVNIMVLKFLGPFGGSNADAIEALEYVIMMKNPPYNINVKITSNSWGGGGFSQALYDAIEAARDADILFIAAAGNASTDNDRFPSYPATYDLENIIAVTATDDDDAQYYNWGSLTVDVAAPGRSILSTTPGNTYTSWGRYFYGNPPCIGRGGSHLRRTSRLQLSAGEKDDTEFR